MRKASAFCLCFVEQAPGQTITLEWRYDYKYRDVNNGRAWLWSWNCCGVSDWPLCLRPVSEQLQPLEWFNSSLLRLIWHFIEIMQWMCCCSVYIRIYLYIFIYIYMHAHIWRLLPKIAKRARAMGGIYSLANKRQWINDEQITKHFIQVN